MCGSVVDIQSATADWMSTSRLRIYRRGKEKDRKKKMMMKKKKKKKERKKETT